MLKKTLTILIIQTLILPLLLWGMDDQLIPRLEIGPSGVQSINDPDLNIEDEFLQIVLDYDEVLAVCNYTLRNRSSARKIYNFLFTIPISAERVSQETVNRFLISYHLNLNDQPVDVNTSYVPNNDKRTVLVQKESQVTINPRAAATIQVLFRVYAGLEQKKYAESEEQPMRFQYAFFQNRAVGQNNLRRFRLTLDKTPILEFQGKINSIQGIPLSDDPRQRILAYSANEFNVLSNPVLIINYGIKGYSSTP